MPIDQKDEGDIMNRIQSTFETLKAAGKKANIGFLTGGDPDISITPALIKALVRGGCDIVEIGVPFSDPLADGPVIQAAANRALAGGVTVDQIFEMVKEVRKEVTVPLVFLMYANTLLVYGKEKFVANCKEAGIDGLIIPDIPYEEQDEILPVMKEYGVELIPLVAPTSKDRVKKITEGSNGFVYCVSSMGVTGRTSEFHKAIDDYISDVRSQTDLPLAIGFGVSSNEDVQRFRPLADGVIVGSAIVKEIERSNGDPAALEAFVAELFA